MNLERHDLDALRTATTDGARFKYVFFWSHNGRDDIVRQECDDAENPTRWRGMNLLGFALMDVRDKL